MKMAMNGYTHQMNGKIKLITNFKFKFYSIIVILFLLHLLMVLAVPEIIKFIFCLDANIEISEWCHMVFNWMRMLNSNFSNTSFKFPVKIILN